MSLALLMGLEKQRLGLSRALRNCRGLRELCSLPDDRGKQDLYTLLGVESTASTRDIRAAFFLVHKPYIFVAYIGGMLSMLNRRLSCLVTRHPLAILTQKPVAQKAKLSHPDRHGAPGCEAHQRSAAAFRDLLRAYQARAQTGQLTQYQVPVRLALTSLSKKVAFSVIVYNKMLHLPSS